MKKGLADVQELLTSAEAGFSRAKTICTLGSVTSTVEALVKLLDAGMSGVRVLMSQSDQKAQLDVLRKVREARALRPHSPCCVMLETRGADLIVGPIKHHQTLTLNVGQELQLINSAGVEGDSQTLICACEALPRLMKTGDFVYFDDGAVICQVTESLSNGALMVVAEGGEVSERRSIIIPGASISAPTLCDRDEDDITNVVLKQNVDFLILSHVQSASAIESVRDTLTSRGSSVKLIAKIKSLDVLEELEDVLEAADGILISAFELGLEVPNDRYSLVQEAIIAQANSRGKPVLLLGDSSGKTEAFSRLDGMALSTAVVVGIDGLVLTKSPSAEVLVQSMRDWRQLCWKLESSFHFQHHATHARHNCVRNNTAIETACEATVLCAEESQSSAIVVVPGPDFSLETIMKFRPTVPLLVVSSHDVPISCLMSGCMGVKFAGDTESSSVKEALQRAKELGVLSEGQHAVVVSGAGLQGLGSIKVVTAA